MNSTQQLVALVLGGGGAAAIFTLVKAYLAIRADADTREAAAVSTLDRWRREAEQRAAETWDRLEHEREVNEWLFRRVGALEHLALSNGLTIPAYPPKPAPGGATHEHTA